MSATPLIPVLVTILLTLSLSSYVVSAADSQQELGVHDPSPRFAAYMTQGTDPQIYVDRYEGEQAYRQWFDTYFVGMSISQAVGLTEIPVADPDPRFAAYMTQGADPQTYVDRYEDEDAYRRWFDTYFAEMSIRDAVGLSIPNNVKSVTQPVQTSDAPDVVTTPEPALQDDPAPTVQTASDTKKDEGPFAAEGRITLANVPRIPTPDNLVLPLPVTGAERIMQKLADGMDDTLIAPPSDENESFYTYSTEQGNEFWAYRSKSNSERITKIYYWVYDVIPYREREEFFKEFVDKAGFYNPIDHYLAEKYGQPIPRDGAGLSYQVGLDSSVINGYFGKRIRFYHWHDHTEIRFFGWVNHVEATGSFPNLETDDVNDPRTWSDTSNKQFSLKSRDDSVTIAKSFHSAHMDIFDPTKCTIAPYNDPNYAIRSTILSSNGLLIDRVGVGLYRLTEYMDFSPSNIQYAVVPVTIPIVWPDPSMWECLVDDWADKIHIPEYARANPTDS